MIFLSIDVGGTFTKYALITETCKILDKGKIPTIIEPVEKVVDMLASIYEQFQDMVSGIALSMPGFIDSEKGFMYSGGSLICMSRIPIKEMLQERCHVPVTVENDAKCAALAEVWQGSFTDCGSGIILVCGTGIGGALIHNGAVISGSHFAAGEFSYIITDPQKFSGADHVFGMRNGIAALIASAARCKGIPATELDGEKIFAMANAETKI